VVFLLDTGCRVAELEACTWGQVQLAIGGGASSIVVDRARVGSDYSARPKSGRARRVQVSRRLRALLLELRAGQGGAPPPESRVLPGFRGTNFRHRQWQAILRRAGIGRWKVKDLRDTFASHLLTRGVSPAYVSKALGHADWSTTARHYGKWIGDGYVTPEPAAPGRVPL
jgi:integrase